MPTRVSCRRAGAEDADDADDRGGVGAKAVAVSHDDAAAAAAAAKRNAAIDLGWKRAMMMLSGKKESGQ
jgi:hypothetical protein